MIITCNNCNKKFDIDSNLIPDKGRLLQCASCDHKWFFKKEALENTVNPIHEDISVDNINIFDQNSSSTNKEESVSVLVSQPIKGLTPAFSVSNLITHLSDLPRPDCMEFFVGI